MSTTGPLRSSAGLARLGPSGTPQNLILSISLRVILSRERSFILVVYEDS